MYKSRLHRAEERCLNKLYTHNLKVSYKSKASSISISAMLLVDDFFRGKVYDYIKSDCGREEYLYWSFDNLDKALYEMKVYYGN